MISAKHTNGKASTDSLAVNGSQNPSDPESSSDGEHSSVSVPETNGTSTSQNLSEEPVFDQEELKGILESLLFVSHDPLTLDKLVAVLEDWPKPVVKATLDSMKLEFEENGRGFLIAEIAGGFLMVTRPEFSGYIKRLTKAKSSSKLSRSALETLAIIGYKQPITRAEIEKVRGVETSGVLRTLLDQKLVRIVGRQDVPGRPIVYGTSKQFLQRFGLRDLRDLPPLKELKDLGAPDSLPLESLFDSAEEENAPQVTDLSA